MRRRLELGDDLFLDEREVFVRRAALEAELLLECIEYLVAAAKHARDVRAHPDRARAAGLAAEHRVERRNSVDMRVRKVERRRHESKRIIGEMPKLFLRDMQRQEHD